MTQYGCMFFIQILCHRTHLEESVCVEQEYSSFDGRHFLEYWSQNRDPGRQGYQLYVLYQLYILFELYQL